MVNTLYVSRTGAAEILGVSKNTIINWEHSGKLVPSKVTDGGKKLYSRAYLYDFLRLHNGDKSLNYRLGYFCISGLFSESYQQYQIKSAIKELGITDIIYDIASVVDYSTGLIEIMDKIEKEHFTELVLIGDVQLSPVILRLLGTFCTHHNVTLRRYKATDLLKWEGTAAKQITFTGVEDEQDIANIFIDLHETQEREYKDILDGKVGPDDYEYQKYLQAEKQAESARHITELDEGYQKDQLNKMCEWYKVNTVDELVEKTGDIDWKNTTFL